MAKNWLMGIDIGAGSLKTMIVAADGRVGGSAAVDINTHSAHPGWSEQDPSDWWLALCETVPRALAQARVKPQEIAAIGFSAGAHTPVLEDAAGKVIRPAILWSDGRSSEEANELLEKFGVEILATGCNRPAPTWTQSQLLWLARHEPETISRAERLYIAKDWLRSRLTGTWETDPTEAVGTLLFDGAKNFWSERLCSMIDWDMRKLPPIVKPTSVVGTVTRAAAYSSGLAAGTPVVCGSSDTSVEAFGAGAIAQGQGTVKLATAAAVSIIGCEPHLHPTLINYPFVMPGHWYTITATNSCASAHRWLRDRFFLEQGGNGAEAFCVMDRLAAAAVPGADGLLFHPYLQGGPASHWEQLLRGDFVGMTFRHDRGHFVRALYEGIAFSLRDALEQLRAQNLDMCEARIIGGGARSATWRQIVADILGISMLVPRVTDASFGAALIAGVGIGVFADEGAAAEQCVSVIARHDPDSARRSMYEEMYGIYHDAALQLIQVNHRLSALAKV